MTTMNISLPEPMRDWVKAQIEGGQYANSSDYVRDLIRRDQRRAEKVQALQDAITKGLQSGDPAAFDIERFKKRMVESFEDGDV